MKFSFSPAAQQALAADGAIVLFLKYSFFSACADRAPQLKAGVRGKTMKLAFEAKFVNCGDALGGEILQLSFDTVPSSHHADERCTPYVLISRNFEFPGSATVEWHDGRDYDGGAEIRSLILRRDRVFIKLDRDLELEVAFHVPDKTFATLKSFLSRMIDARVYITE